MDLLLLLLSANSSSFPVDFCGLTLEIKANNVHQFEQISEVCAGFFWNILSEAPFVWMMCVRIIVILLILSTGLINRFHKNVILGMKNRQPKTN